MTAALAVSTPSAAVLDLDAAIRAACDRIAPVWPLKHFVAVNPFLGFIDRDFAAAAATLHRVAGVDMVMPRAFYRAAYAAGELRDADLAAATGDAALLKAALTVDAAPHRRATVATVAELIDGMAIDARRPSLARMMVDEIAKWCAAYFDEGQSAWRLPVRGLPPYAAWRASMAHDRSAEVLGLTGFRAAIAALPAEPIATIRAVLDGEGVPPVAVEDYLFRALFDVGGWAAYARYREWNAGLQGRADDTLVGLLAIRVAWGYALFRSRSDTAFRAAWAAAMATAAILPAVPMPDADLATDLALHEAWEAAQRRALTRRLHLAAAPAAAARPSVQAALCIDVRSEVFRRALEGVSPETVTLGFAGFFGFPIEYIPIGRTTGGAQCPVLLTPAVVVAEGVAGATPAEEASILRRRLLRRRIAKACKAFKLQAVSSFAFVETVGLGFAAKLAGNSLGLTRPVVDPNVDGLDAGVVARIGPRLDPRQVGGRATGFPLAARIEMAAAVLRGMSLTAGFAPLVLLAGHGSSTVNNPHASGLDCGACGGHTGEANARVAAGVLNDPQVRVGLRGRGIDVPDDTWFVAGLHDTTTDAVRLFDTDVVPAGHRSALTTLTADLARAGARARRERASLLGVLPSAADRALVARSRDWSQVRPEWGLAGCAAFVAAPRWRTRGLDLGGRVFLHDYDWVTDDGFGVLQLILTAPMVVASWINLQYYGSTVNNRAFGSGNKTLHNVVGQLGVIEGNGGDLRVGLPLQSVDDGTWPMHAPVRLSVFVEAPTAEIERVLSAHEDVRRLVDHRWLFLSAIAADGSIVARPDGGWRG